MTKVSCQAGTTGHHPHRRVNVDHSRLRNKSKYSKSPVPVKVSGRNTAKSSAETAPLRERVESVKSNLERLNQLGRRFTALLAFRRKYYNLLTDEVTKNVKGTLSGVTVSAKYRKLFDAFGKFGASLELAGYVMEGTKLSWDDTSVTGLAANISVSLGRGAVKAQTSLLTLPSHILLGAAQAAEWGLGQAGYKELEWDFHNFTTDLDASIKHVDDIINTHIDATLSVENAKDVLNPSRSVINPKNWGLLFGELAYRAGQVVDSIEDVHVATKETILNSNISR